MDLLHSFGNSLIDVMSWPAVGFMVLGVLIGFLIGMLPGLGGPVAIAIMLPFTFAMSTSSAFAFLIGAISVLAITGDITSILYGIPGDPGSAALVLDGHPMAVKGEAGRAIGAMLSSSVIGAILGAIILGASIPIMRPILLHIRSPEYFALGLLGLTFITAFGGSSLTKGLISGGLGLLLSMVGVNQASGIARYTFGQLVLWDGISLVPVAIGLFAIPAIIDVTVRGVIAGKAQKVGDIGDGVRDTFKKVGLMCRCSMIGAGAGLIPGLGGTVAQWLAYAHSAQTSENPALMGNGSVDGVIGPGAAQNSKEGANLIALAVFGIPTSATMALLLGALTIKGLVPGIPMVTKHVDVMTGFVWVIVLSHFVAVAITVLIAGQLVKITTLRAGLLLPPLISIAFLGALAERGSLFDVWLALVFGVVGLLFKRFDWPSSPLIIGLVLGSMMERNFAISVTCCGLDWVARPLVATILLAAVAALLIPVFQMKRRAGSSNAPEPSSRLKIKKDQPTAEIIVTVIIAALSIAAVIGALSWPLETRLFPLMIAITLALLSFFHIFKCVQAARREGFSLHLKDLFPAGSGRAALAAGALAGFAFLVTLGGFGVGAPVAAFLFARFVGKESWMASGAVMASVAFLMWGASQLMPVAIYTSYPGFG